MPEPTKNDAKPAGAPPDAAADLFGNAVQPGAGDGSAGMPEHRLHGEVLRVVYAADDGEYAVIRLRDEKKIEHTLTGPLAGTTGPFLQWSLTPGAAAKAPFVGPDGKRYISDYNAAGSAVTGSALLKKVFGSIGK